MNGNDRISCMTHGNQYRECISWAMRHCFVKEVICGMKLYPTLRIMQEIGLDQDCHYDARGTVSLPRYNGQWTLQQFLTVVVQDLVENDCHVDMW